MERAFQPEACDFSGWATRNDLKCSDGRVIRRDAFKHDDGIKVPLVWNHQHNDPRNVLGHASVSYTHLDVYKRQEQLKIYAALFCLEYKIKPADIDIELRLYQNNEILYDEPTAEDIVPIMDKIITFDKVIRKIKEQEG